MEENSSLKRKASPSVMVSIKETQTLSDLYLKCNECDFETPTDAVLDWHLSKVHGWSTERISDFLDTSTDPRNCKRCDYEAEDKYDLDAHTWTEHEETEDEHLVCNSCDKIFASLKELMNHKKRKHSEKVSNCWKFQEGCCPFGEDNCWFIHNSKPNDFKCSICDENFKTQTILMKHRKSEHGNSIKKCKNNEGCLFKNECWYKHEEMNDNDYENDDKKENHIQKLFEVVEKCTEKVTKLENINLQNNK